MQSIHINIVQLLTINAIINGLIFCFLLLTKKQNKEANRFLALLLLSLSFTVLTDFFLRFLLYDRYPLLQLLPFTMTYWIGPAFYFYIKYLIQPTFQFKRIHWWHFSLIGLNYIHSIYHLIYGRGVPHPLFHNFTEAVGSYAIILICIYLLISYKNVKAYQQSILKQLSTTDNHNLNWINQLITLFTVVFIFVAIFKLIDYKELIDFSIESSDGYLFAYRDFLQLSIGFAIFWLSIGGYRQLQTINNTELSNETIVDNKDYSRIIKKLIGTMEHEKLYLDATLNLKTLSQKTNFSEKEISIALNQHHHKNFYHFVNEYRVEEIKKRLAAPQFQHLKILSIAYDCGFNSKATFNRIFKKYTGKSPKDFRNA